MTKTRLEEIVDFHGLKINGYRQGAGKFRDVEIGIGASLRDLVDLIDQLREEGVLMMRLTNVTNPDHEDYPNAYVEVGSFWWDD